MEGGAWEQEAGVPSGLGRRDPGSCGCRISALGPHSVGTSQPSWRSLAAHAVGIMVAGLQFRC